MCTIEKRGDLFILTITGNDEHRLNPTLIDSIRAALNRAKSDSESMGPTALITTADGKFFSNGYDLSWALSDRAQAQARSKVVSKKFRLLVADLISLPMPTIAAVTGHASAAGFILALSHDYLLMRKDRGFLYMSGEDPGRNRGGVGIVDSAHENAEKTVEAAVRLGMDLVRRKWDGQVYADNRRTVVADVLAVLGRMRRWGILAIM
ncbi:Enoyl-CoA delta isomerase 1, peroxisomal [Sesamum alatum]|uniref:Enoyl-CoA delta isomerase 1, peroxisomal n=1 Tax=Sesamum alatum TaxID=300844 RepID=A0AAE1YQL4_9LAMI|nr:Enoyl-CoA delta isomerase 1, peroxisomal [Sesamum alatum]